MNTPYRDAAPPAPSSIELRRERYRVLSRASFRRRWRLGYLAAAGLCGVLLGAHSLVPAFALTAAAIATAAAEHIASRALGARLTAAAGLVSSARTAGELALAAATLDELADREWALPALRALTAHYRAVITLRLGDDEGARWLYTEFLASGWDRDPALLPFRVVALGALGAGAVRRGELEDAERFRRQAHAALNAGPPASPGAADAATAAAVARGSLLVLDALVAARAGRYEETAELVSRAWTARPRTGAASNDAPDWVCDRGQVSNERRALLEVLGAFANARREAAAPAEIEWRSQARVEELDRLARTWPELDAYLRADPALERVEAPGRGPT